MSRPAGLPFPIGHFHDCGAEDVDFGPILREGNFFASFCWPAGHDKPAARIWDKYGDGVIYVWLEQLGGEDRGNLETYQRLLKLVAEAWDKMQKEAPLP